MTTLQMHIGPHFQAPVTEDPMELTSDMDQRAGAGDDIDLDLDLTGDHTEDEEDEYMGEEDANGLADSTSLDGQESPAALDDEMVDDTNVQGQVQLDEEFSVRDEDIADAEYSSPQVDQDTIIEPDIDHQNGRSEELLASYEGTIGDQDHEQDYQEREREREREQEQEHLTMPEVESDVMEGPFLNGHIGLVTPSHDIAEFGLRVGKTTDGYDFDVSKESTVNHGTADQTFEPPDVEGLIASEAKLDQVGEEVLSASSGQENVTHSNVEDSHTQEEDPLNNPAPLHPVVLDYQGDEMFLFPPVNQNPDHTATFLLEDEQLAYSTIGNLLEACRGVLKGSLSEQDEMVINVDDLNLHISESTVEAASIRLSEIVGLYIRLQENDGLEKPPPLYMDLTSRTRFSCRLSVLQDAVIEGKGLSQLNSSQAAESDQQYSTEREKRRSCDTAVLSSNETHTPKQQPGEEVEESINQYDSRGNPLLSEILLLETDSAVQGEQSHPVTYAAHDENDRAEAQLGRDHSFREERITHHAPSEAARSKELLQPAQSFAGSLEFQKAETTIVDDGDVIDYEDVEELEGVTSSASSTLQGDAFDVVAVQDHAAPNKPIMVEDKEHRTSNDVQEIAVAEGGFSHSRINEKDTSDVGVPAEEEQPDPADYLSQKSDEERRSPSEQFDEEREAPEYHQDASISQEVHADDRSHEASAQHEDDAGSYRHDKSHERADQTEGDEYPVADININGETGDYSLTHQLQPESSESGRSFRKDDLRRVNGSEVEDELEKADGSLASDDNDQAAQLPEKVSTQHSFMVDESAQTPEDDDEITYEDEEYEDDFCYEPAKAEHNVATSPASHKRARTLPEDEDDALEEDLQRAKRVRSE